MVRRMRPGHVLLAIGVAAIWGINFVFLSLGLHEPPPLLLVALRFVAVAVPAVFVVGRPGVSWRWIVLVGLTLGLGQFGLLTIGMRLGMSAGLSSLVLQRQVLFTILFAGLLLKERIGSWQVARVAVAFGGLGVAAADFDRTSPLFAFLLCVAAAAMWGVANIGMRRAQPPDSLSFIVWVSLVPPVPLAVLSLLFDGARADWAALTHVSWPGIASIAYLAYAATLAGYGGWGWLLKRFDASMVSMYSLLVPPIGIAAAVVVLGERISGLAAILIIGVVVLAMTKQGPRAVVPIPELELTADPT